MRTNPYKFKPIRIPIRLDKLVDVFVYHPFGYHCEAAVAHCHSQQREHVRVAEALPCYNLFAKSLHNHSQFPHYALLASIKRDPR